VGSAEPKDHRWYYVVNTPIRHADGTMSKQSMIMDITERKLAEEALQKSEERILALVENTSDMIWSVDAKNVRPPHVQWRPEKLFLPRTRS